MTATPLATQLPEHAPVTGQTFPVDDEIAGFNPTEMDDEYGGKVWRVPGGTSQMPREIQQILGLVGYVFVPESDRDESRITHMYAPDTVRLRNSTTANHVPVELIPEVSEEGRTPGKLFRGAVRRFKHIVGVASTKYLGHDTGPDHILAPIVGKEPLIQLIVEHANPDLDIGVVYDFATEYISGALMKLFDGDVRAFNERIDEGFPRTLLHGPETTTPMNRRLAAELSSKLRLILHEGLDDLGIAHRNIVARPGVLLGRASVRALVQRLTPAKS